MAMKSTCCFSMGVSVLLLWMAGCSSSDRPELVPVEGTVLLDGQPVVGAAVCFKPDGARTSRGLTDAEGHYELIYLRDIKGAVVGRHKVSIASVSELPGPKQVPAKYGQALSTLTADVKPEANVIDFDLKSP